MSGAVEGVALLPCPFCGGEAHHPTIKTRTGEEVCLTVVWCKGCEIEMHNGLDDIPRAAEQWNTRTTPPARSYADGAAEQVARLRDAYNAVADWPEKRGDPMTVGGAGFMDLLKLRNLVAELLDDPAAIRLLSQEPQP
jgi:Lar family restriction alleviation protein